MMSQSIMIGRSIMNEPPEYIYTGNSQLMDDGKGNWRIKFFTDGILTTKNDITVDVFLVGGGGGGGCGVCLGGCAGGGSGGHTLTSAGIVIYKESSYAIVIGVGGEASNSGGVNGGLGGMTTAFDRSIGGGEGGYTYGMPANSMNGGSGGSGGAGGGSGSGVGGADGGNGPNGWSTDTPPRPFGYGGAGQGTTTGEFGMPHGYLYAGGGNGGSSDPEYSSTTSSAVNMNGGQGGRPGQKTQAGAGKTNTGGGGGGGSSASSDGNITATIGGNGGSGIVVIRNAR